MFSQENNCGNKIFSCGKQLDIGLSKAQKITHGKIE